MCLDYTRLEFAYVSYQCGSGQSSTVYDEYQYGLLMFLLSLFIRIVAFCLLLVLVDPEDHSEVHVPLYNWHGFLDGFKPLAGMKQYQHFR